MRIPSGSTDRYIYFVALDSTDLKTREPSLTTFTVYASKNGAAAAAFTTPTVNETSSANMPGVYELLLDEQTTLAAGNDTEELCLHITHAGMAPVTRTVEIYRPETTEGRTLAVESDGHGHADLKQWLGAAPLALSSQRVQTAVGAMGANVLTASAIASAAITSAKFGAGAITSTVLATDCITSSELATTAVAEIQSGLSTLDAAGVRSAVGLASADLDTQLDALPTANENRDAILDRVLSVNHETADTPGFLLQRLDALISSRMATFTLPTNFSSMGIETDGHVHADLKQWLGVAPLALASQYVQTHLASTGTGTIDASAFADNAITNSTLESTAIAEIQSGLSTLTEAQVNAQVLDVMATDTLSMPGQGAPPASPTFQQAMLYLYKAWRNRSDQSGSLYRLYADNQSTVDQKASVSDNGTVTTKEEIVSGP